MAMLSIRVFNLGGGGRLTKNTSAEFERKCTTYAVNLDFPDDDRWMEYLRF